MKTVIAAGSTGALSMKVSACTRSVSMNGRKNAIDALGDDEKNDTEPEQRPAMSITSVARSAGPPAGYNTKAANAQSTPADPEKIIARRSLPALTRAGRALLRSRRQLSKAGVQSTIMVATKSTKSVRNTVSQKTMAIVAASSGFATETVGNCRTRASACDTRSSRSSASEELGTEKRSTHICYCAQHPQARLLWSPTRPSRRHHAVPERPMAPDHR